MSRRTFYVTTPLYYVNAKPHLGTLYSTLLADVTARWQQLMGREVFFLTGTDEHGQKIAQKAQGEGEDPKQFVDKMVPQFHDIWHRYQFDYTKFIRTTDEQHQKAVVTWIEKLKEQGDIYKAEYSGWYCTPCETFVTHDETGERLCPTCQRPLHELTEENYFFRLSAYQEKLLEFYESHPDFIAPTQRLNEVLSFVRSGLQDLSISRTGVKWGIPFPGDSKHTVYVWADALLNYISAVGYGQADEQDVLEKWWPADLHIMAKDIVRFHAVYWPAFLMAAGLELPKKLLVHGYILIDQEKMSKSKGNVVDPEQLAAEYGVEPVRYYLTRHISTRQDGHFSIDDLEKRITADLANTLGNLLRRVTTLAVKNECEVVTPPETLESASEALKMRCEEAFRSYWDAMNHFEYHVALSDLWSFISEVNVYFNDQKPWEAAKKNKEFFVEVLSVTMHSLYTIGVLLWPVMPTKMEALLAELGMSLSSTTDYEKELRANAWNTTFNIHVSDEPLFKKLT